MRGLRIGAITATISLLAAASASAEVRVGQVPDVASPATCGSAFDFLQPTVTSGSSYVMPYTGTITSWLTYPSATTGLSMSLKIFRKVGNPATYRVVGHDGPHLLAPPVGGGTEAFPANLPVEAGDVLGVGVPGDSPTGPACTFPVSGDHYLYRYDFPNSGLQDGEQGDFATASQEARVNAEALLQPSNQLTLGAVRRNAKKGTAVVTVQLPNPGTLSVSGKGVKAANTTISAPGTTQVVVKAAGRRRRTLARTGKVKLNPVFSFLPENGVEGTGQSLKLKLRKTG
jgi:hypothetical protein